MIPNRINLVIPLAGEGLRFKLAGYKDPKPFISVNGVPMIIGVIDNFHEVHDLIDSLILICRTEHLDRLRLAISSHFPLLKSRVKYITVDNLTEGAACTVLFAYEHINNNLPLIVANSDQFVDWDEKDFLTRASESEGCILTFDETERNPKWSFVELDAAGRVSRTVEKRPVSDLATVGIYFFRRGADFVEAAVRMMIERDRTNNEFYLCPVFNYLIRKSFKISIYKIDKERMRGLGTPEDLEWYLGTT